MNLQLSYVQLSMLQVNRTNVSWKYNLKIALNIKVTKHPKYSTFYIDFEPILMKMSDICNDMKDK